MEQVLVHFLRKVIFAFNIRLFHCNFGCGLPFIIFNIHQQIKYARSRL